MTDPTTDATTNPADSALRPAESDLHPADPTDDLTANTPGGDTEAELDAGAPLPGAPLPDAPLPDAPLPGDTLPGDTLPGDTLPGDGSVAHDRPEQPDAMRTATHGRESAAARADLSDDRPTPTATPAG